MKWGLTCRECNKTSLPTMDAEVLDPLKDIFVRRVRPLFRLLRRENSLELLADEFLVQLRFLNQHRLHLDEVEAVNEFSREVRSAHG